MKKGLIIGGIILAVLWVGGVSFFVFGQIYWNRYMVNELDQHVDAINQLNNDIYGQADTSVVR